MIEFFRDVLDGPLYIITTILAVIFIMAIIGFLMERKKLEKEAKSKIAVVSTSNEIPPIQPVTIQKEEETPVVANQALNEQVPISNFKQEEVNSSVEVKIPVIVFEDPDQKKE